MVPSVPNGLLHCNDRSGASALIAEVRTWGPWTSARPGRAGRTTSTTWNGPCSATSACSAEPWQRTVERAQRRGRSPALAPGPSSLTAERLDRLFDAQLASRHLDHAARWLRGQGHGFYTIGSAGHEANALVAAAAAAHGSGAAALPVGRLLPRPGTAGPRARRRARRAPRAPRRPPTSRSPAAGTRSSATPISAIIPQTSTIASHLPRALGVAFAIARAARVGVATRWPDDADRRVQLRGRLAEPLDRAGRPQRRRLHRVSADAAAAALRVRGQRVGDQRPDAGGLGRRRAVEPAGAALRTGRGHRPDRRVRRRRGARRPRPDDGPAGGAAPARGEVRRPRRHRRRVRLPHGRRACGPTRRATRCWRRRPRSSPPGSRPPTRSSTATSTAAPRCGPRPSSSSTRPSSPRPRR